MDTLSATPTPDADMRLADLERQLAELRAQFHVMTLGFEHIFDAGRANVTNPRSAALLPLQPVRGRSNLRLVSGGAR